MNKWNAKYQHDDYDLNAGLYFENHKYATTRRTICQCGDDMAWKVMDDNGKHFWKCLNCGELTARR